MLSVYPPQPWNFRCVIPEIDIWRAATLMLKRYGDKALSKAAPVSTNSRLMAITTAPTPGVGSQRPLSSSPTPRRPDRHTDYCGIVHTLSKRSVWAVVPAG